MPNLTDAERRGVVEFLLKTTQEDKIPYGTFAQAADKFQCSRWTITRIWQRYQDGKARHSLLGGDVSSKIKKNSGRKGYNYEELLERIKSIPASKRQKMRKIAMKIQVSLSVIQRLLKKNKLRRHSNAIKPLLTPANRLARVKFAAARVDDETLRFDPMYDVVHIDEKWFYEDVDKKTYYLVPGEEPPKRRRKSKRYIGKTMFLSAVARPR